MSGGSYYEYRDWITWPEADIREYAQELVFEHQLDPTEADHLETQMTQRAGFWPTRSRCFGPTRMGEEMENAYRTLGLTDAEILEKNELLNRPESHPPSAKRSFEFQRKSVGSGLTKRFYTEFNHNSKFERQQIRRSRRSKGKQPFSALSPSIREWVERAKWEANCYPIDYGIWLVWPDSSKPFEGLVWYANALELAYSNARNQSIKGNTEVALWHAFRAGKLQQELELLLAHGARFEKYSAVNQAQRDAATSRKIVSDERRREAYWRHRKEGNKRAESGRLAGVELGLSEGSIRSAFPDARYPID